jgi:hypothetical protein
VACRRKDHDGGDCRDDDEDQRSGQREQFADVGQQTAWRRRRKDDHADEIALNLNRRRHDWAGRGALEGWRRRTAQRCLHLAPDVICAMNVAEV